MWLSLTSSRFRAHFENMNDVRVQVGAGDGYNLTVGGFNAGLSTLGDSMAYHNGMMFSTK